MYITRRFGKSKPLLNAPKVYSNAFICTSFFDYTLKVFDFSSVNASHLTPHSK